MIILSSIEQELKEAVAQARLATQAALAPLDGATPVEQALIRALEQRYQAGQATSLEQLFTWNDAYAASMRDVYKTFPDDPDVTALFAEAMIDRTPWQLWDLKTGEPAAGADTLGLSGRSGTGQHTQPCVLASGQCVEPARLCGMPETTGSGRRGSRCPDAT